MSKLAVYDINGSSVGDMEVSDDVLAVNKGSQAVHDVIVAQMAARRGGNASTLRKGEVAGSNKKPWRQKGTGRARAGYRQSPVWRGGGIAFGPHPRSYAKKVNKRVARLALRSAFGRKVSDGEVKILDDLEIQDAKTKSFVSVIRSLGIKGPALFVLDTVPKNVLLASGNIPDVEVIAASELNVYQMVRYPVVVLSKAGMKALESRMMGNLGSNR